MLDLDELGVLDVDGPVLEGIPATIERLPEEFRASSMIPFSGIFPSSGPATVGLVKMPEAAGGAHGPKSCATTCLYGLRPFIRGSPSPTVGTWISTWRSARPGSTTTG
jgi:hypothetical protein